MEINSLESDYSSYHKRTRHDVRHAGASFSDELAAKVARNGTMPLLPAEEMHRLNLLKAKRKRVHSMSNDDEEDSIMQQIQEIKKRLKKIRALERLGLGI